MERIYDSGSIVEESHAMQYPKLFNSYANNFVYVRSGVTQSNACILNEFAIDNSTLSARLQCGIPCNALLECVGVDIIGRETKRCRLLSGFPALIPTQTTSDETARYQKV